jgi:hypothetical protein
VATEDEIRLGRLAVKRGYATEEQVLDALRERNAQGPRGDLGRVLAARGLVTAPVLEQLKAEAAGGGGAPSFGAVDRADASTDHAISITGTREVIARDQVEEALLAARRDPRVALRELRRLAQEFSDTESGVRAGHEAKKLEAAHPELRRP